MSLQSDPLSPRLKPSLESDALEYSLGIVYTLSIFLKKLDQQTSDKFSPVELKSGILIGSRNWRVAFTGSTSSITTPLKVVFEELDEALLPDAGASIPLMITLKVQIEVIGTGLSSFIVIVTGQVASFSVIGGDMVTAIDENFMKLDAQPILAVAVYPSKSSSVTVPNEYLREVPAITVQSFGVFIFWQNMFVVDSNVYVYPANVIQDGKAALETIVVVQIIYPVVKVL
ncbi:UNKNOWN [Stylonychia lemnae]|uniref:Uncharacterized protein n=1 Tax=Stylonychia lemnae TaxID=5949 RepID=A0A078AJG0_STYLE|nr:UNKNOWN [Stylonychia lemnae]|eukprot:CDW81622.1 UNKNOWN [Stylonychia lemnae]